MLYEFLFPLADKHIVFNLFQYITFRAGAAMFTAVIIAFVAAFAAGYQYLFAAHGVDQPLGRQLAQLTFRQTRPRKSTRTRAMLPASQPPGSEARRPIWPSNS